MRVFVQMRRFFDSHKELAWEIEEIERTVTSHDEKIQLIFQAIRQLIEKKDEPAPVREPVGFGT
jgi:hypothetical protein